MAGPPESMTGKDSTHKADSTNYEAPHSEQIQQSPERRRYHTERRYQNSKRAAYGARSQTEQAFIPETIEEAPGLKRRILLLREFRIYEDVVDAHNHENGHLMQTLPALYTVLDSNEAKTIAVVGDEKGEDLGYIDLADPGIYDWNSMNAYVPNERAKKVGHLTVFVRPDTTSASIELPLEDFNVFPIVGYKDDAKGNRWFQIGASLVGRRNIGKPVWVRDRNTDGQVVADVNCICVTGDQLEAFSLEVATITNRMSTLNNSERSSKSMGGLLSELQAAYLQISGLTTEKESRKKVTDYLKDKHYAPNILRISIDDIARLDDSNFQQWLKIERLKGNPSRANPIQIQVDGITSEMYIMRIQ